MIEIQIVGLVLLVIGVILGYNQLKTRPNSRNFGIIAMAIICAVGGAYMVLDPSNAISFMLG